MVRVALEPSQKKAALVSVMVAGIAAASVWAAYWVWHQDQPVVAVQRDLTDVIVSWKCPAGHLFDARGAYQAKPCPTCRQPAQLHFIYVCPSHGNMEALVMYDEAARKLSAVRFGSGDWISVDKIVPCPKCGGEVRPKQRGPFDEIPAQQRGEGEETAAPAGP
jgi:hypothetical protein